MTGNVQWISEAVLAIHVNSKVNFATSEIQFRSQAKIMMGWKKDLQ